MIFGFFVIFIIFFPTKREFQGMAADTEREKLSTEGKTSY